MEMLISYSHLKHFPFLISVTKEGNFFSASAFPCEKGTVNLKFSLVCLTMLLEIRYIRINEASSVVNEKKKKKWILPFDTLECDASSRNHFPIGLMRKRLWI